MTDKGQRFLEEKLRDCAAPRKKFRRARVVGLPTKLPVLTPAGKPRIAPT
jgi:hypothetical protein